MMGLVSIHLLYLGVFKNAIELSQYSFFEFYFSITNLINNSLTLTQKESIKKINKT
jgi:hypothetical protein